MLYVDTRAGSKELIAPLRTLGLPVEGVTLEYGDIAFVGRGAKGAPLDVGIEYKKLPELITSIRDGRFAGHQLPGLVGDKGRYDHAWLLIEGSMRKGRDGTLQQRTHDGNWNPARGAMNASELEKHLLTYEMCTGLHVRRTLDLAATVAFIGDAYRWFTDRDLDQHRSHIATHEPPTLGVSEFRAAVMKWPGVGMAASKAAEFYFGGSIVAAASGTVSDWRGLPVKDDSGNIRRFGNSRAERLVRWLSDAR